MIDPEKRTCLNIKTPLPLFLSVFAIGYRQSQRLGNFAKALIYAIDGTEVRIDPFNEDQNQEIKPALFENASDEEAYRRAW